MPRSSSTRLYDPPDPSSDFIIMKEIKSPPSSSSSSKRHHTHPISPSSANSPFNSPSAARSSSNSITSPTAATNTPLPPSPLTFTFPMASNIGLHGNGNGYPYPPASASPPPRLSPPNSASTSTGFAGKQEEKEKKLEVRRMMSKERLNGDRNKVDIGEAERDGGGMDEREDTSLFPAAVPSSSPITALAPASPPHHSLTLHQTSSIPSPSTSTILPPNTLQSTAHPTGEGKAEQKVEEVTGAGGREVVKKKEGNEGLMGKAGEVKSAEGTGEGAGDGVGRLGMTSEDKAEGTATDPKIDDDSIPAVTDKADINEAPNPDIDAAVPAPLSQAELSPSLAGETLAGDDGSKMTGDGPFEVRNGVEGEEQESEKEKKRETKTSQGKPGSDAEEDAVSSGKGTTSPITRPTASPPLPPPENTLAQPPPPASTTTDSSPPPPLAPIPSASSTEPTTDPAPSSPQPAIPLDDPAESTPAPAISSSSLPALQPPASSAQFPTSTAAATTSTSTSMSASTSSVASAHHKQARKFARSADKRQSVHMLGSIEHLQYHFTKFGLAAKETPDVKGATIPALGRSLLSSSSSTTQPVASTSKPPQQLPDSPIAPRTVPRPDYPLVEEVKVDLNRLRGEAREAVRGVVREWKLSSGEDEAGPRVIGVGQKGVSVLNLLKMTVEAIRTVRAYSLALPLYSLDTDPLLSGKPGLGTGTGSLRYPSTRFARPPTQAVSTSSRPALRAVSGPLLSSGSGTSIGLGGVQEEDPLAGVRKAALEVLAGLRGLEERCRVEMEAISDEGKGDSRSGSPEVEGEGIQPDVQELILPPIPPVPNSATSEDDDLSFFFPHGLHSLNSTSPKKSWYEQLVAGDKDNSNDDAGYVYQDGLDVEKDMKGERTLVEAWVGMVGEKLFGRRGFWKDDKKGGVENAGGTVTGDKSNADGGRATKTGDWADEEKWVDKPLHRVHAFLLDHLPLDLMLLLPSPELPDFEAILLERLSDGYILIIAYNTYVQRSPSPWGMIAAEDIHDTLASTTSGSASLTPGEKTLSPDHTGSGSSEGQASSRSAAGSRLGVVQGAKREWTFRRAGNLRFFGAAVKQRFAVPLSLPAQQVSVKHVIPLAPGTAPTKGRRMSENPKSALERSGEATQRKDTHNISYDPAAIARRDEGWKEPFAMVLQQWVKSLAMEANE